MMEEYSQSSTTTVSVAPSGRDVISAAAADVAFEHSVVVSGGRANVVAT
jgi:hypothetical protein